MKSEEIQPAAGRKRALARNGSGAMFDSIAARYDLLNRLMSFGLDRAWRRKTVAALALEPGGQFPNRVLDVATGTADIALAVAHAYPQTRVVGVDPSAGMLEIGRQKVVDRGLSDRVVLEVGDGQKLTFADSAFDALCIAFGIRNIPDRLQALREMARVTRPGGRIVILELSEPRSGWLAPLARFHIHTVVPRLGALLSGSREYRYLQNSIAAFPEAEEFANLMRTAGIEVVDVVPLTLGVCHLYIGTPQPQPAAAVSRAGDNAGSGLDRNSAHGGEAS